MIPMEIFATGVLCVSIATNLTTEAVKKLVGDRNWNWNIVSCIIALVLAIGASVGYVVNNDIAFTTQLVVAIVFFAYASWLCATLGYDKVKEAFSNIKN